MKRCIYPGTFDPITNGHLDVIERALGIFDEVIVAIALSESKSPCFSLEKRLEMTRAATAHLKNVKVEAFSNLLVEFASSHDTRFCIRGLRAVSDFEYELQLSYTNTSLWDKFESVFLMPSLKNAFISSSMVRTILRHGGDVSHLVPSEILPMLKEKQCL